MIEEMPAFQELDHRAPQNGAPISYRAMLECKTRPSIFLQSQYAKQNLELPISRPHDFRKETFDSAQVIDTK